MHVGSAPVGFPSRVFFPHDLEPHPHLPRAAGSSHLARAPWHALLRPAAALPARFCPHWAALAREAFLACRGLARVHPL